SIEFKEVGRVCFKGEVTLNGKNRWDASRNSWCKDSTTPAAGTNGDAPGRVPLATEGATVNLHRPCPCRRTSAISDDQLALFYDRSTGVSVGAGQLECAGADLRQRAARAFAVFFDQAGELGAKIVASYG